MANPSIRGHQASLKFLENGGEIAGLVETTKMEVSQDSSFSRSFYVGQRIGEGDQTVEGWSGSADFEVKDASVDDLIDALVTNNLNGIGVSDYSFVTTENYGDGVSRSWVYFGLQWKMSRSLGGLNEKVTKRLEFQAAGRLPI
jgi:hypothetical protein